MIGRTNVIVPFYQRERGILPVAVNSALAEGGDDLLVTVVDDGSPVSAHAELAPIIAHDRRVVIIEQANAGPGAARNRGLDAVPDDVAYIAFLDSDDRWLPGHLANGLTALRLGADFYFSQHSEYGSTGLRFAACGAYAPTGIPLPEGEELFFYKGDLFEAILRGSPIGTSTVLFRRSAAPKLRFPTELIAGEDAYFWVGLSQAARQVAYSMRCEVAYGLGVNLWGSRVWGTYEALRSTFDASKAGRLILRDFAVSAGQRQAVAGMLADQRQTFATTVLHLLRRGKKIDLATLVEYVAAEPRLVRDFITLLGRDLLRKARALAGAARVG